MRPRPRLFFAWIGPADLDAANGAGEAGLGPVGGAVKRLGFDEVVLLTDRPLSRVEDYQRWLGRRCRRVIVVRTPPTRPMGFSEIYEHSFATVERALDRCGDRVHLTFHIDPAMPEFAAAWLILGKTRFPGEFFQSSPEDAVRIERGSFDFGDEPA